MSKKCLIPLVFLSVSPGFAGVSASAGSSDATTVALQAVIAGDHRSEANAARDNWRHPQEVLTFFGLETDMTVVEMWPGSGRYYTEIIAPLVRDQGAYYAANFDINEKSFEAAGSIEHFAKKNAERADLYGNIIVTAFSDTVQTIAPPGSADMVVTFRNIHNFTINGYVEDFFAAMYTALKPGGVLGVVEHRGDPEVPQDPRGMNGYINQDYAIQLAEAAGFVFEASSEVNANPKDIKDYPEGVWTLPPTSRLKDTPENATYLAIGETDRMTLRFRKPAE